MNGFEQIKSFYSWVFNNPDKARPTHVSLYLFLWNQANRANWAEWIKIPYDLAMQGACIGNNGTYYKCLDELQSYGLIEYQRGINLYKAPIVKLIQLYDSEQLPEQVTVPLSEQLTVHLTAQQYAQLTAQQSAQLPAHIYKLITDNIKLITDNFYVVQQCILSLGVEGEKPSPHTQKKSISDRKEEFRLNIIDVLKKERNKYFDMKEENKKFFEYWSEHSEKAQKMRFEKEKAFDISLRLDRWHTNAEEKKQKTLLGGGAKQDKVSNTITNAEKAYLDVISRIESEELQNA